tara:strand:+ start:4989 stop:5624 length:636 start_codon:yes stop_codon:yes gene_type:complete
MKKKVLFRQVVPSLLFVAIIITTKLLEDYFQVRWTKYGVYPRSFEGVLAIITSPFIHGDWKHVFNNSVPLIVLGTSLRYFYKDISKEVFLWSWFMSGLWLWAIGRPSFHIGASGIVYALASFLFFSGLIRKHTSLMAVSLVVVFLYGSMVWGIFPIKEHISWEGHLSGGLAGVILAWWFRFEGPPKQKYQYEIDEELEENEVMIEYHYKEN